MQVLRRAGWRAKVFRHRITDARVPREDLLARGQWHRRSSTDQQHHYRIVKDEQDGVWYTSSPVTPPNVAWIVKSDNAEHGSRLSKKDMNDARFLDPLLVRDQCMPTFVIARTRGFEWRDRGQCSKCVDPHSGQKKFRFSDLSKDLAIARFEQSHEDPRRGTIHWKDPEDSTHQTQVDLEELYHASSQAKSRMSIGSYNTWFPKLIDSKRSEGINVATYEAFLHEEISFTRILTALRDYGIAFLKDVPHSESSVETIGERIGPLRHTFYGRTWDVKDKLNAENVAYTSGDLELHMDLLYMKQPPGLQLLHCLQNSGQGGASTFCDSFAVATELHKRHATRPAFDTLCSYPVSYHYNAPGRAFFDTKPTIELATHSEDDREVIDISCDVLLGVGSDNLQYPRYGPLIKNISWSPPFQAPFSGDVIASGSPSRLRDYLTAARAFSALINSNSRKLEYKLQEGECVIFNNRRILHGRTAFTTGDNERWLKGAYLDSDDFESQLRHRGLMVPLPVHKPSEDTTTCTDSASTPFGAMTT